MPEKKSYFAKFIIYIIILAVIGVFGFRIYQELNTEEVIEIETVRKVSLLNVDDFQKKNAQIEATGVVESLEQIDIKSELSSKAVKVNAAIGQEVHAGDVLVELNHADIDAQLAQAAATIERLESGVDQRVAGATDQEIARAAAAVAQATAILEQTKVGREQSKLMSEQRVSAVETALKIAENNLQKAADQDNSEIIDNAYKNLVNVLDSTVSTLASALTASDNIMGIDNTIINDVFEADLSQKSQVAWYAAIDSYNEAKKAKVEVAEMVSYLSYTSNHDDIDSVATYAVSAVETMTDHLADMTAMLNATSAVGHLTPTMLDGFKAGIGAARASVSGAASALSGAAAGVDNAKVADTAAQIAYQKAIKDLADAKEQAKNDLKSADASVAVQEASLAQAEAAYNLTVAGPRDVDLAGLLASVKEAKASVGLIQNNKNKAFIRAPFDGIISEVKITTGDLVSFGQMVVSLVNPGGLQLKVYLNEKEINMIGVGSAARIEDGIEGSVAKISPRVNPQTKKIETIIAMVGDNLPVKIGQYARAQIRINEELIHNNIYFLPLAAVKITSDQAYVYLFGQDGVVESLPVALGKVVGEMIEVNDGLFSGMEILESTRGIKDGQKVELN
ncbi:MAG TPA: efflux RND transporter periplasmic adaptor subunit [Candidatus Bipolaricaulota bacterium]|nr:efflux RND transporter periplasmic adaptor subunit [Candidatus Bipolaricaulota bacterium]